MLAFGIHQYPIYSIEYSSDTDIDCIALMCADTLMEYVTMYRECFRLWAVSVTSLTEHLYYFMQKMAVI